MTRTMRQHVEPAPEYAGVYRVRRWPDVAVRVVGWETEPLAVCYCPDCGWRYCERAGGGGFVSDRGDENCEHHGSRWDEEPEHERTGRLLVCMIGDDRWHSVDPANVQVIARKDFCGECGQIGCHCDAYEDD